MHRNISRPLTAVSMQRESRTGQGSLNNPLLVSAHIWHFMIKTFSASPDSMVRRDCIRMAGFLTVLLCLATLAAGQKPDKPSRRQSENRKCGPVLWRDPTDIRSRNLFYGPGGTEDRPQTADFDYEKEDLKGTSPKFDVR